jgi:hypothetical protein
MIWLKLLALGGTGLAAALALTGASQPPVLGTSQGGLWEIVGAPGAKAPVRQCLADVTALAGFEHRGKPCRFKVIKSSADSTVVEYSCGPAGFGRSEVDVITPRSLRIDTQGISNQAPFSYVLQARRVGDCPASTAAKGH